MSLRTALLRLVLAPVGVAALVACSSATEAPSASPSPSSSAPAPASGAPVDTSTPADFVAALRDGVRGMGQCDVRQTVAGEQFGNRATIGLQDPVAAKIDLAPSPSAGLAAQTTLVLLEGRTYVQQDGGDGRWRVVAEQPVSAYVGEMDCRSVLDDLESAASSVRAVGAGDVSGRPVQRYEVTYDPAAWATATGGKGTPGDPSATLVASVADGRLAGLEVTGPVERTTEYVWSEGAPDVAAPPADLVDE